MNFEKIRLSILVGTLCFLAGKYIFPPEVKTEIKEVVKFVEKKEENKKVKTVTRIKETKSRDGSSVKDTVIVEDSSNQTTTNTDISKESVKIQKNNSGIRLGILAIKDVPNFSKNTEIGVLTSIPIFGKLSLLGSVDSTKRVGIGLALEF